MLNERDIIAGLKSKFPDYIGDDAAVIPLGEETSYVLSKDLLMEDIHFRTSYFDAASLAHKALQVNLSDIAAMGAKPTFIMLGISIPVSQEEYALDFIGCFAKACLDASVVMIGGDTTKSPDKLCISVTAIGTTKNKHLKYRKNAKPKNLICTIGNLGDAHLGLIALEQKLAKFDKYKNSFLRPVAKMNEGLWLGEQSAVTAMMDISDGLYIDLERLCAAAHIQGNLILDNLNPTEEFIAACEAMSLEPQEVVLTGGEDYGLLFTVQPEDLETLANDFIGKFGYELKVIGNTSEGTGINFTKKGEKIDLKPKPFTHFGEA